MSKTLESLTADTSIAKLLDKYPQLIQVFMQYHMSCIGCSMAHFDTLKEAAENYGLPLDEFISILERAARPAD